MTATGRRIELPTVSASTPLDLRGLRTRDAVLAISWIFGTIALGFLVVSGTATPPRIIVGTLLVVSLVAVVTDAKQDLRLAFRARNLVLLFCFYFCLLSVVQNTPDVRSLTISTQQRAAALYCLFVALWLLAYSLVRGSKKAVRVITKFVRPIPGDLLFTAVVVIFVAEIVRRLAFVGWDFGQLIDETLVARSGPVSYGRGRFGDWKVILEPFTWLFFYVPPLAAFAWDSVKSPFRRATMVGCALAVLTTMFFGGSRGVFAMPVITVVTYRLLAAPDKKRRKWVLGLLVVAFVLTPLMDLMVRYRNVGWRARPVTLEGVAFNPVDAHRDNNFESLGGMMDAVRVYGHRSPVDFYFRMVISPVPRFLWPSKPHMSQDYLGGYRAYYVAMTSVGDMYMYGGLLHVVLGALFFGWAVRTLDRYFVAAIQVPEWRFFYLVAVWIAILSLRAIWAVVVHTE